MNLATLANSVPFPRNHHFPRHLVPHSQITSMGEACSSDPLSLILCVLWVGGEGGGGGRLLWVNDSIYAHHNPDHVHSVHHPCHHPRLLHSAYNIHIRSLGPAFHPLNTRLTARKGPIRDLLDRINLHGRVLDRCVGTAGTLTKVEYENIAICSEHRFLPHVGPVLPNSTSLPA